MKREKRRILGLILAGAVLAALAPAVRTAGAKAAAAPSSRLWIDGDSTLHSFKSSATDWSVQAALKPGAGPLSGAGALRQAVLAGKVAALAASVSVQGMRSGESGLDRNLVKALKGFKNPQITFKMKSYRVLPSSAAKSGALALSVQGELSIAGRTQAVELNPAVSFLGDSMRISGRQKIFMTDYGVKPPTLFLGAVRVANRVMVGYELVLDCRNAGICTKS